MFELGLENRWDGFMLGVTEIKVSVPIYNETSVLSLTGDSNPVLLSVGGTLLCSYTPFASVEVQTLHRIYQPS